jgi:uncharacterized membrane protein YvbJ
MTDLEGNAMICKHCGSQLSIEDEKCSFCGLPNEEAKQHIKDMQHYNNEFNTAKGTIAKATGFVRSFLIFIVIAAILAVANVVVLVMNNDVYNRAEAIILEETKANLDTYKKMCEEAYENEDYYTLYHLYYDQRLVEFDDFKDYYAIVSIAYEYLRVYSVSMNLHMYDTVILYSTKDDLLQSLGDSIKSIYDQQEQYYRDYNDSNTTQAGREYADHAIKKMELFLENYLKLTKEDIALLSEETPLQISMIIGRRMGIYE